MESDTFVNKQNTTAVNMVRYSGGRFYEQGDDVAVEYPLTIVLDGEEFATVICTPSDLQDFVVGFLAAEGVILNPDQIKAMTIDDSCGYAYVETSVKRQHSQDYYMRRFIGSCCGKSRHFYFQNDAMTARTVNASLRLTAEDCLSLMNLLHRRSAAFKRTGGVHNAALCTRDNALVVRVDIGRHNTLDKIYGYCLRYELVLKDKLIVFSGRVSSEVLLKVAKMGIGVLLSKSAPTDLAIQLAEELNITLVGFIRQNTLNVYTHMERIEPTRHPSIGLS